MNPVFRPIVGRAGEASFGPRRVDGGEGEGEGLKGNCSGDVKGVEEGGESREKRLERKTDEAQGEGTRGRSKVKEGKG